LALRRIKDNPHGYSLVLIGRSSQEDSHFPKQVQRINDQIDTEVRMGSKVMIEEDNTQSYRL